MRKTKKLAALLAATVTVASMAPQAVFAEGDIMEMDRAAFVQSAYENLEAYPYFSGTINMDIDVGVEGGSTEESGLTLSGSMFGLNGAMTYEYYKDAGYHIAGTMTTNMFGMGGTETLDNYYMYVGNTLMSVEKDNDSLDLAALFGEAETEVDTEAADSWTMSYKALDEDTSSGDTANEVLEILQPILADATVERMAPAVTISRTVTAQELLTALQEAESNNYEVAGALDSTVGDVDEMSAEGADLVATLAAVSGFSDEPILSSVTVDLSGDDGISIKNASDPGTVLKLNSLLFSLTINEFDEEAPAFEIPEEVLANATMKEEEDEFDSESTDSDTDVFYDDSEDSDSSVIYDFDTDDQTFGDSDSEDWEPVTEDTEDMSIDIYDDASIEVSDDSI